MEKLQRLPWVFCAAVAVMMAACGGQNQSATGTTGALIGAAQAAPAPAPSTKGKQVATLAEGCFWSAEAIFKQLKGVDDVEPGYAGGHTANPTYDDVCTGDTGHAETVQVTFDPKVLSYADLLRVYFTADDPTTLNRQGPDDGTQYRSVIFYHNDQQKKTAQAVMAQITAEHLWPNPIVTQVVPYTKFYPAEEHHRNYYNLHPDESYCKFEIAPKIANFRAKFPDKLKP